MVDLLGKSDRVIATGPPVVNPMTGDSVMFYPGHSKYDAEYSVQKIEPDVVIDLPWDVDEPQMGAWGYVLQCTNNGTTLFLLAASSKVLWDQVNECP